MDRRLSIVVATLLCTAAGQAVAQHDSMHHNHAAASAASPDPREILNFPPAMEASFLGNMRDHMRVLDGVLQAVANGEYQEASRIAAQRLGLDSPSAAGCKPGPQSAAAQSKPASAMTMDEMMTFYMPEPMRAFGLAMHTAASEFAKVAAQATTTPNDRAVIEALSRVTGNCVGCHAAYRLR